MDSGNTAEALNELEQPDEVVVTDSEATEAKPQAEATEQEEFIVDVEGDQQEPKNSMSIDQAKAAWRKEQSKRKEKQAIIDKEKEKNAKIQQELDELKKQVGTMARGSKPTLASCEYDESLYEQKLEAWYSSPVKSEQPAEQPKQDNTQPQVNDEADFHLYHHEQALQEKLPGYSQAKDALKQKFASMGASGQAAINDIANIAYFADVDPAKAIFAFNNSERLINDLAATGGNQKKLMQVIKKAANSVKTRSKVAIDTQPEPKINNQGPVDNTAAAVDKAFKTWQESGKVSDYKKLVAIRKQAKTK